MRKLFDKQSSGRKSLYVNGPSGFGPVCCKGEKSGREWVASSNCGKTYREKVGTVEFSSENTHSQNTHF